MKRTIFHVDVNSAFLSWEAAYRIHHLGGRLDLRDIPSAIGGDVKMRHGIILAKSIPAKPYGIQTGMTIPEAIRRCPKLYLAPPNYSLYERCSGAFLKILKNYTPDVEVYSIDEAFLDMTETLSLFGTAEATADMIRKRIRDELGFTVNIGISTNKLLAKMAGDLKKPDYTHTLYPEEIKEKMWPLPIEELFFCGRASAKKLRNMGIQTIRDLAGTSPELLQANLKSQGRLLWNFANGFDFSAVESKPAPQKGIGNSTTAPFDVKDLAAAKKILLGLSETVGSRLRKHGVKAGLLSISLRDCHLDHYSHQKILERPTHTTNEIYRNGCELLLELWNQKVPLRQLGLHTGKLSDQAAPIQLCLFGEEPRFRMELWDQTIDEIRHRYGKDAVFRAAFAGPDPEYGRRIDHMEGGVSREKRTVDYSKLQIL